MLGIFLRIDPIYAPDLLRGARPVREQPVRQTDGSAIVRGLALTLALLLVGLRVSLRLLLTLCEQAGRAAPTLLLIALLLGGAQAAWSLFTRFDLPLAQLYVKAGTATGIEREQVQKQLSPLLADSGFFSLDLDALRLQLESLPLIASVSLRRRWPGQLDAQLQMHQPLARWGEQGLLVEGGQVLAEGAQHYLNLPQLIGPSGSEQALFEQYQQLANMLRPLGLGVAKLIQHEHGSGFLTATDQSGKLSIEFALGSGQWMEKMQRFIHFAKQDALHLSQLSRVDLRHRNGFATATRQTELKATP